MGFLGGSDGKESACKAGDLGSIPGLEKSPGEWNTYPLQYLWLENSMDRGAWRGTFHGVAKSRHNRVTNTIRFVYCNGINNDSVAFAIKLMNPYFFFLQ